MAVLVLATFLEDILQCRKSRFTDTVLFLSWKYCLRIQRIPDWECDWSDNSINLLSAFPLHVAKVFQHLFFSQFDYYVPQHTICTIVKVNEGFWKTNINPRFSLENFKWKRTVYLGRFFKLFKKVHLPWKHLPLYYHMKLIGILWKLCENTRTANYKKKKL